MAMPSNVLTRVSASAPADRAAPATSSKSATLGLSLAHTGRPGPAATTAPTASEVADAERANMCRRSSTFGQLRLTSTATTWGGAPARREEAVP
jgi:hypothetical protein